ncbi:ATP-grasp domain-containing protein [Salinimonas sediminis]|nr:hypothetical protein [Salinimonas sediminis]
MNGYILLIGHPASPEIAALVHQLTLRNQRCCVLDTSRLGVDVSISWDPVTGTGILATARTTIAFSEIHAAFWDQYYPRAALAGKDTATCAHEWQSLLETLLTYQAIRWYNSIAAIRSHRCKPQQLYRAVQHGLTIPVTCIGNDPSRMQQFLAEHEQTIIKPVHGGAFTELYRHRELQAQQPTCLPVTGPMTLQEYIEGTNIRSYVINTTVISAELRSACVDFRQDTNTQAFAHELPEALTQTVLALFNQLGMQWGAIDWRLDDQGRYVFLEANPAPRFTYFEQATGYAVASKMAETLIG